jgi:quercetin dioxygenase-like cupin family protein
MPFIDLRTINEKEHLPGCRGKFIHSENMTLVYWNIQAGSSFLEHSHPHEQVTNVTNGKFELTIDGKTQILEPSSVAFIPSNMKHAGKALTDCQIIDIFFPIREDYQFDC